MFFDGWEAWLTDRVSEGCHGQAGADPIYASPRDVVVMLDAFKDPRAERVLNAGQFKSFNATLISRIHFYAETLLFVDDKPLGKLFLFDYQARDEFSVADENHLRDFADTLAGLIDDHWERKKQSADSGVHMQQHILEILRSVAQSLNDDRAGLATSWSAVKTPPATKATAKRSSSGVSPQLQDLNRRLHFFQRKLVLFDHIYELAMGFEGVQLGISETETQLQLLEETGKTDEVFTYCLDRFLWQQSFAQLLTEHYAEQSITVHFEHRFDPGQYLVASDPALLQFCVAVLVGHVYANVQKVHSIKIVTTTTHAMTGLRHLCIQITCGLRMVTPPDDLQAALDTIVQQYFCGRCRIVTESCFQILVPFLPDRREAAPCGGGAMDAVPTDRTSLGAASSPVSRVPTPAESRTGSVVDDAADSLEDSTPALVSVLLKETSYERKSLAHESDASLAADAALRGPDASLAVVDHNSSATSLSSAKSTSTLKNVELPPLVLDLHSETTDTSSAGAASGEAPTATAPTPLYASTAARRKSTGGAAKKTQLKPKPPHGTSPTHIALHPPARRRSPSPSLESNAPSHPLHSSAAAVAALQQGHHHAEESPTKAKLLTPHPPDLPHPSHGSLRPHHHHHVPHAQHK
eukprot:gene2418-1765_t